MIAHGVQPALPPLPDAQLVEWLMEIGPIETGGMAGTAISWITLDAWCNRTGIDLQPWQSRLLRRLSGDWLAETDRAKAPDCAPPWTDKPTAESWKVMEDRLEKLFDRLG